MNIQMNDSGEVTFDLFNLIRELPEEKLSELSEFLGWDMIIDHLDCHLKGGSDFYSWDTSGYRGGAKIREHIEKIQGTRDQRIVDLESERDAALRQSKRYEQYYDWYFRFYHADYDTHLRIEEKIGKPGDKS